MEYSSSHMQQAELQDVTSYMWRLPQKDFPSAEGQKNPQPIWICRQPLINPFVKPRNSVDSKETLSPRTNGIQQTSTNWRSQATQNQTWSNTQKPPPKEIPGNESSTYSKPSVSMTSMSRPFSRRLTQPLGGPLLNGSVPVVFPVCFLVSEDLIPSMYGICCTYIGKCR